MKLVWENSLVRQKSRRFLQATRKSAENFIPCRPGEAAKKTGLPKNGAIGDIFWEKEQRRSKRVFVQTDKMSRRSTL